MSYQERQKARFLTKEDVERLQTIEVKRLADERELEKKIAVVERDRKDFEREEVKRAKNDSRAADQRRREEERAAEVVRKESQRSTDKVQREQSKKNERHRQQYKKDINNELRRNRAEAQVGVRITKNTSFNRPLDQFWSFQLEHTLTVVPSKTRILYGLSHLVYGLSVSGAKLLRRGGGECGRLGGE
jgi:hypothetical protein